MYTLSLVIVYALGIISGAILARKDTVNTVIDTVEEKAHTIINDKEGKQARIYSPNKAKENSLEGLNTPKT